MVKHVLPVAKITPTSKNFTIEVMVIEKEVPKLSKDKEVSCQRFVFQDSEGTKIQAAIFGANIAVFQHTLKQYHTYSITNPPVSSTPEALRFLDHPCQLTVNSRCPVEEIPIVGLPVESINYHFTSINDVHQFAGTNQNIDMLFAVTQIGSQRAVKDTFVVDVQIIDQSLQPMILSLWDRFTQYELQSMIPAPDAFPVVIGLRLKASKFYGVSLATKPISGFVFNSPIPEAKALQTWCQKYAVTLKNLPSLSSQQQNTWTIEAPPTNIITKVADLPQTVSQPQIFNVQGTIEVHDFAQPFCYIACPICKRATYPSGDEQDWCNSCKQKVSLVPRIKFEVRIVDSSGYKDATIFEEVAEKLYKINEADIDCENSTVKASSLQKFQVHSECTMALKAKMQSYKGADQLKFSISRLLTVAEDKDQNHPQMHQQNTKALMDTGAPVTPSKKTPPKRKRKSPLASSTSAANAPESDDEAS